MEPLLTPVEMNIYMDILANSIMHEIEIWVMLEKKVTELSLFLNYHMPKNAKVWIYKSLEVSQEFTKMVIKTKIQKSAKINVFLDIRNNL